MRRIACIAAAAALVAGCTYSPRKLPDGGATATDDGGGTVAREAGTTAPVPGTDAAATRLDAPAPTACNAPGALCSGSCVDPKSTTAHCGRCGNACPAGANAEPVCKDAACGLACKAGYGDCTMAPGCETLVAGADRNHCGACNQACEAYQTCGMGKCSPEYLGTVGWGVRPTKVAAAKDGSFYVAGLFSGTVDFDPGPGEYVRSASGTDLPTFLSRFDSAGKHLWTRTSHAVSFEDLAVAPDGGVISVGMIPSLAQFLDGPDAVVRSTRNDPAEAFVMRLKSDGSLAFLRTAAIDYADGYSMAYSVSLSPDGHILVAGHGDPGQLTGVISKARPSGRNGFLVLLNAFGDFVWERHFETKGVAYPDAARFGPDGSIWVAGSFGGATDFDPDDGVVERSTASTDFDAFLVKLMPGGSFGGVWLFQGEKRQEASDIITAADGSPLLLGFTGAALDLDPGRGSSVIRPRSDETGATFVVKLSTAGEYQWSHSFVEAIRPGLAVMARATDGGFLLGGGFSSTVNFNPTGSEDIRLADVGSAFVTKLGSDGSYGGTITMGPKEASVAGFGVHDSGFVVVGTFVGAGDFNPGRAVQTMTVQASSGFLSRYGR